MDNILNLTEIRKEKYNIKFSIGEVIFNKHFKQIIIDNDLEGFLKKRTNKNWGRKTLRSAMKNGVVQTLLMWVSTDDYNDVYLEDIRIIIGLDGKIKPGPLGGIQYDKNLREIRTYTTYYQVVKSTIDISAKLKSFDEALEIFKKSINEFISGINYRK